MANKTIYLTEEGEEIFRRAKEMAGDSISSVITASLKKYILDKEAQEKGLQEIVLWVGTEDHLTNAVNGRRIKFVGKLLSEAKDEMPDGRSIAFSLYYTRKGQFLLHEIEHNKFVPLVESRHEQLPDFAAVQTKGLPAQLIFDAEKQLPEVPCEELDI